MSEMLKMLFSLSVSGTLLLCLLLLFYPLYKHRFSKSWQYYIWLLVIFRFLIPATPDVSLVGELFKQVGQRTDVVEPAKQMESNWMHNENWREKDSLTENIALTQAEDVELSEDSMWLRVWIIWLVIAIAIFIRKITLYQSFVKYLKAGSVMVEDIELLEKMGEIAKSNYIRGRVELWTNDLISSPLLLGFFHPRIVLTTKELSDVDFYYTVLHELTHYKRRDMFYKWLIQLVVCVHWFNPFVYVMERKLSQACELACDEAVLEGLSGREKREYGDMLLRAVGVGGSYKNSAAFVTLHESKKLLKGRLEAIMTFKEKTKRDFTLSVLMTSLLAVSGAAVGAYAAPVSAKIEDIQVAESKQYDIRYVDSMKDVERVEYEMPQEEERMNWLSQYRQMCWWQDEYIFWIGWNVYEYYWGNCIGEEILLTDGSAMYVQFDEACNWVRADQDAMQALKTLLVRVRDQKEDSSYPLVYPIVVSGEYVGNVDAEQLADVYYMEDKKSEFAAIFPRLEKEKQENYLEQFYENEEINDLYLILKYMENNLIFQYVERAYENDETRIFSVLVPFLEKKDIERLYDRAMNDDRSEYQEILLNYLSEW